MLRALGAFSIGGLLQSFVEGIGLDITEKKITSIKTEILIIGGGTAGVVAAIQAARAGCSVTIIENGSQLGGTITTGGVSFPGLFYLKCP